MPRSFEFTNEGYDSPLLRITGPDEHLAEVIERSGVQTVELLDWKRSHGAPKFLEAGAQSITELRVGSGVVDLSVVSKLENLFRLSSESPIDRIDFSRLRALRRCSLGHVNSLGDLGSATGLLDLRLDEVVLDDLRAIARLRALEYLKIWGKKLGSLRGIEKLAGLRALDITYTKIESKDGMDWIAKHFEDSDAITVHANAAVSAHLDLDWGLAEAAAARYRARPSYRAPIAPAPTKPGRTPSAKGPQPGCLLLLIDQSGSMAHGMGDVPGRGVRRRADVVADAVNLFLRKLIERCVAPGRATKGKILDWWHIGVIGYGATRPVLGGALGGRTLIPISELAANPLRKFAVRGPLSGKSSSWQTATYEEVPAWLDPVAEGPTRARNALDAARRIASDWIAEHPRAFPPIIIDICDDGETAWGHEPWLRHQLRQLSTEDGPVLLFRVQVCRGPVPDRRLPEAEMEQAAGASSRLPATMLAAARELGLEVTEPSRGLLVSADTEELLAALDVFTAVPGFEQEWRRIRVATPFPGAARPKAWPAGNTPKEGGASDDDPALSGRPASEKIESDRADDDEEQTAPATRHLRFGNAKTGKFWQITLEGDSHTVHFGRTGTGGQTRTKRFPSHGAARRSYEGLVKEKLGKGYREVAAAGGELLTLDAFWALIERSRKAGGGDVDAQVQHLEGVLEKLDDERIIEFGRHFETLMTLSYRYDLWGAAFVVNQGCSDDAFDYFRGWLIAQGRKYFEAALVDPENAGKRVEPGDTTECESILSVAARAYETRTGDGDFGERVGATVTGRRLKGKVWEEDDLPRLFPRLTRKFGDPQA